MGDVNMKKSIILAMTVILALLVLSGCTKSNDLGKTDDSNKTIDIGINNPIVTITMETGDTIEIELYPEIAPNTVNNFISLIDRGFYDGLIFHRVIPEFMIQGGDPDGQGTGGPDYSIKGEFTSNGFDNPLKHEKGVISMARSRDMDSAGSQFFVIVSDATHLDGSYAAFGKVTSGMEVVEAIVAVERDSRDKPLEEQKIASMTVDKKNVEYGEP
jgi:peptidyl-prolyl cis-trans isomerase B (cyclophilin B)